MPTHGPNGGAADSLDGGQGGVPGGVGGGRVGRLPEKKADEKCSTGVRLLMTHLCHKPIGGGAEISQCSSLSAAPLRIGLYALI